MFPTQIKFHYYSKDFRHSHKPVPTLRLKSGLKQKESDTVGQLQSRVQQLEAELRQYSKKGVRVSDRLRKFNCE